MSYRVNIHFHDGRNEEYEANGHTTSGGVLQLWHFDTIGRTTKTKIFPLIDITEITVEYELV